MAVSYDYSPIQSEFLSEIIALTPRRQLIAAARQIVDIVLKRQVAIFQFLLENHLVSPRTPVYTKDGSRTHLLHLLASDERFTQMFDMVILFCYRGEEDEVDILDEKEATPLMNAASSNNVHALKMLLQRGANPNIQDEYRMTALDYAEQFAAIQCYTLLLKAKDSEDE